MLSYLWTSPVQTRLSSCRQVCPSAAQPVASCSYSLPVNRNTGWHCHHALSSRGAATRHPSAVANAKSRRKEDSEQVFVCVILIVINSVHADSSLTTSIGSSSVFAA